MITTISAYYSSEVSSHFPDSNMSYQLYEKKKKGQI